MKIALLGYGTVGSGVFDLVYKNKEDIKNHFDKDVEISNVLVRNIEKYSSDPNFNLFTTSFEDVLAGNPDIIVEVMGGLDPAYRYVTTALNNKIPVVTANKDLLAAKGKEIFTIAREQNTRINFEASIGGGIPVVKALQESLSGNQIQEISAVINGTTNFILTKMYNDHLSYDEALTLAQEAGFAESDPTADVEGLDAVRKLIILSSLSYKKNILLKHFTTDGITQIKTVDVEYARQEGYKIKLLAISQNYGDSIYGAVRPVYVTEISPYGKVENEFNGVILTGDSVGEVTLLGKGAGKYPTASAIYGDICDIIQNDKIVRKVQMDDQVNCISTYAKKSKWIVRFQSDDCSALSTKLMIGLAEKSFKINRKDASTLFVEITTDNEDELISLLSELNKDSAFEYKHYLIYG